MTERTLQALIDGQETGTRHENNNLWAFEYARSWLEDPTRFALSPHLPLDDGILVPRRRMGLDRPLH
jgi:serine/threonine-protein kinase HipA